MRKVGTTQTKDQIADILREYILSGRLTPEADIVQEDLAELLQLSRTPVREALQVLEQEGLLERLSNRHMRVVPVTQEEILTIFQVLGALEGEILSLLSGHPEKWGELTRLAKEHALALNQGYPGKCRELEKTFHLALSQELGIPYLQKMHQKVLSGYPFYAMDRAGDAQASGAMMTAVLERLAAQDQSGLRSLAKEYFQALALRYEKDENK
ncbi:GntR family transcriptional regulator [Proteiniclasticum sp. BAD-10]|uniref:GntR family transcriptional regulator n=1 Tax=Proteiniclasticum sediminis TaxID=2804028 RepID=A0A941CTI4_9CLOT|nr:GntR family transcriptional regulator [Proteiniclasticum sediminis]MBR0577448.1 GntR family transcriptional regulator [Proteiniclasticum sediminis]